MNNFSHYFELYPVSTAPFMHRMLEDYRIRKPFAGMTIAHNVPLTRTTLLKIACLKESGAVLTVTNPSFIKESKETLEVLEKEGVLYTPLHQLKGTYDFLLDCGAELVNQCQATKGIVELTRTGAIRYENYQDTQSPIVSVDDTRLKSLETCLGTGEGVYRAISQLSKQPIDNKKVLIFGFGKVGTGIAYYFAQKTPHITVIDMLPERLNLITSKGYTAVSGSEQKDVEIAIKDADIIITATGIKDLLSQSYKRRWFKGKILANAGAEDEFGFNFSEKSVLANKKPVNFALEEPTLMEFLDPIFFAHNLAIEDALHNPTAGFRPLDNSHDNRIVKSWAQHHNWSLKKLDDTF
ncbi:NAD(P)-dependent oxidoreductase [Kangiella marina]|uniref:NAD(P)-dependent oxidoreductase n=1 Tax=Kangiella marina TaxID=1079178 RepID=A0ABP8INK2_9GAMM